MLLHDAGSNNGMCVVSSCPVLHVIHDISQYVARS